MVALASLRPFTTTFAPSRRNLTTALSRDETALMSQKCAAERSISAQRPKQVVNTLDRERFEHELVEILYYWLRATQTKNGFFRSNLTREWLPAKKQTGTLVSQSRLLYVMATGYDITGDRYKTHC